jgi:hypothetical protein
MYRCRVSRLGKHGPWLSIACVIALLPVKVTNGVFAICVMYHGPVGYDKGKEVTKVSNYPWPTNSMEMSPSWEASSSAAIQELSTILWNRKVHYRVHKSPPLVPILIQIGPVYTNLSCLSKIHFNVIYPTYFQVFLVASLLLAFPPKSYMLSSSPHSSYTPFPPHPFCHGHSNYTWRGVQVMKLVIMQFSHNFCHFISSVQKFSSVPCARTPSVCVSPLMLETKFHTHAKPLVKL